MDMLAYVRSKGKLTEREARPLFHQICAIVADFHSKGVVLNDIKLRKFFFIGSQRTKVSTVPWEDALILENPQNDMLTVKSACPIYASPEILHKSTTLYSGRRHDCWCLGVILYTMLTGHYPFQDNNTSVLFAKIMKGQYEIPDYISPSAEFLIRSLLNRQPKERLTARAAMQDRWFTERDPFLDPGDLLPECQLLETDSYSSYTPRSPVTYTISNSSYRIPANVSSSGSRLNPPPLLQLRYLPPNRLCSIKASLSISNDQIVPEMNNCQNKSDEIFHWTLTSGLLS